MAKLRNLNNEQCCVELFSRRVNDNLNTNREIALYPLPSRIDEFVKLNGKKKSTLIWNELMMRELCIELRFQMALGFFWLVFWAAIDDVSAS